VALRNIVSRGASGPYEQHLLTRLMQDVIGANSSTIMVATVDASNAQVQGVRELRKESWQNQCNMRFFYSCDIVKKAKPMRDQ